MKIVAQNMQTLHKNASTLKIVSHPETRLLIAILTGDRLTAGPCSVTA
jgi:hypothetical protein